MQGSENVKFN